MIFLLTIALMFSPADLFLKSTYIFQLDSNYIQSLDKYKYRTGDDSTWSKNQYDDSQWLIKPLTTTENKVNICWKRFHLNLIGNQDAVDYLVLDLWNVGSAYELYWDGQLLLQNGKISICKSEEIPGKLGVLQPLERKLTLPGRHVLAIRLSNFHKFRPADETLIEIGYNSAIKSHQNKQVLATILDLCIFLFTAVFCLALFLGGGRQRPYLFLSIYCFLISMFDVIELLPFYSSMTYSLFIFFEFIRISSLFVRLIFLITFIVYNYNVPDKKIIVSVFSFIILIHSLIWGFQFLIPLVMMIISLILVYAVRLKSPGSLLALCGFALRTFNFLFISPELTNYIFFSGEALFLFLMMMAVSRQIKMQNSLFEASKLRSLRLECQLLKKNIQPHFLMNTLLSIISWIEEKPVCAVELIQSLADEFRIINRIASEKLIRLSEEIELCRTHLKVMALRKNADYCLLCENIPENESIPPMILHTLIENGLTHGYRAFENGVFKLTCSTVNNGIRYVLQNDGSHLNETADSVKEGMGLRYVKSRLEESYSGRWDLFSGVRGEYWQVIITIEK